MSSRKSRKYSCPGCLWRHTTRDALVEHMLMSREGSLCQKALVQCPHCKKHWPSLDSLEAHLRCDIKCKRAENIPHTVSFVKIHGNNSASEPDKNRKDDHMIKSMMFTHLGVDKHCRNTARISNIMQNEADCCEPCQENEHLMNFRKNVNKSETAVNWKHLPN